MENIVLSKFTHFMKAVIIERGLSPFVDFIVSDNPKNKVIGYFRDGMLKMLSFPIRHQTIGSADGWIVSDDRGTLAVLNPNCIPIPGSVEENDFRIILMRHLIQLYDLFGIESTRRNSAVKRAICRHLNNLYDSTEITHQLGFDLVFLPEHRFKILMRESDLLKTARAVERLHVVDNVTQGVSVYAVAEDSAFREHFMEFDERDIVVQSINPSHILTKILRDMILSGFCVDVSKCQLSLTTRVSPCGVVYNPDVSWFDLEIDHLPIITPMNKSFVAGEGDIVISVNSSMDIIVHYITNKNLSSHE